MRYFYLILAFTAMTYLLSCNNAPKNTFKLVAHAQNKYEQSNINTTDTTKMLEGIWAENNVENPVFFIMKDSLYYLDRIEEPIVFKFRNDSLIMEDGHQTTMVIKRIDNDSLWLELNTLSELWKLYRR